MHPIVGSESRRCFKGESRPEDLVGYGKDGSEKSSDIGRQSPKITNRAPKFQVPDLFEDGHRRPAVCLPQRHGFQDAAAGLLVARSGHCVDDDVRVDEEQLLEALFDEFVESIGSQEAGSSSDNRSIGAAPIFFWYHTEVLGDRLSDERRNRCAAALGLLLDVAALLRGQQYLKSFAVHTHSIHIA
jgi:hypothetical protein